MPQTLTLRISDEAFVGLQRQAVAANTGAVELAASALEHQFGVPASRRSAEEKQAARERFQRHFGSVDLGHPTGSDNEGIDADLTAEYAHTHESV